jgi:hypothetical protein
MTGWFVRSLADHDTHRGVYCPAIPQRPRPLPIGLHGNRIAFPGPPPDPDQTCLACQRPPHRKSDSDPTSITASHPALAKPSRDVS